MFFRTVAAALLISTSALAAEPMDPADWSGGYAGLTVGALRSTGEASLEDYEGGLLTLDVANGLFPPDIDGLDVSAIGGATLGYNHQRGAFVTGVEFDFSLGNSNVENGFARVDPNPDPMFNGVNTVTGYGTELDGLATLRLRAGYATGNTLLYATGGLAAGRVENRFSLELSELGYASDWSASDTRFGYVVGAGIEHKVSARLSVKAEILGYDLRDTTVQAADPVTFPGQSIDYKFDNAGAIGRIGLNFRF